MKRLVAGLLLLASAERAWAQESVLTWNYDGYVGKGVAAWAVKTPAAQGVLPQIQIAALERPAGAPATARVATLEVDCAKKTARAVTLANYDAAFVKTTEQQPRTSTPQSFAMLGQASYTLEGYCAGRSLQTLQATGGDALKWLNSKLTLPAPVSAPGELAPPTGRDLSFELAGTGTDIQRIDSWLETTTIKREGNLAKAWVFEAWQSGWTARNGKPMATPATWRLYEFECAKEPKYHYIWFAQLDPALAISSKRANSSVLVAGTDQSIKQIGKRVCHNRAMLFSETFKGSEKELAASWYGAASSVGVAAKPVERPRYTAVDLGQTIRMTMDDNGYKYTGVFTRQGASSYIYTGEFHADAAPTTRIADTIEVLGIRNGMLHLNSDFRKVPYAITVTDGKTTGNGVVYSARGDDTFSWKLAEPTTITAKTPAASQPVAPAPAAPPAPIANPAPALATPPPPPRAKDSASLFSTDAFDWQLFKTDSNKAVGFRQAEMPAGKSPRIHIVVVYAKDRMIEGNPDLARTHVRTVDLKCDTSQYYLWEDRTLSAGKQRVGNRVVTRYLNASELLDLEPLYRQACAGTLSRAKDYFGTMQQAIDWLTTKIQP